MVPYIESAAIQSQKSSWPHRAQISLCAVMLNICWTRHCAV